MHATAKPDARSDRQQATVIGHGRVALGTATASASLPGLASTKWWSHVVVTMPGSHGLPLVRLVPHPRLTPFHLGEPATIQRIPSFCLAPYDSSW
jgi:hypothetical protein